MPPLFAGIPDDTMLTTQEPQLKQKQQKQQQKQPKQRKLEAEPPPQPPAAVFQTQQPPPAVAEEELQGFQTQQPQQPQQLQDRFAQHLASIHATALEARARLHDKLDEVLKEGRYALKTALRELEGAAAGAKQLVDEQLQSSLEAARREAELARASALRAEALSGKLAMIRGRVEGTEEGEEGGEGGEGGEDSG